MRRDEPGSFFSRHDPSGHLLARRNHWLTTRPELCLATTEWIEPLVDETWKLALEWGQVLESEGGMTLENLARQWEADLIFLDSETFTLAGGCVCFPSNWNLQESTGRTLGEVHGRVPGLTEQIGEKIDRFLQKLPAGQAFLRENWGLTRTNHLNYHPQLNRPRLDENVALDEVFLRIEHQAFVRLESGVLLGVRIEPVSLMTLLNEFPETASRLRRKLETMPEDAAVYKGLERARSRIVTMLDR